MSYQTHTQTDTGFLAPVAAILGIYPDNAVVRAIPHSPSLRRQYDIVMGLAEDRRLPVKYVGQMPVPVQQQVFDSGHHIWVLDNATRDPLMDNPAGFPMPQRCRDDLKRIRDAGISFTDVMVAHELPRNALTASGHIAPEMLTPRPSRQALNRANQRGQLAQTLITAATVPLLGLGLVAAAGVATVAVAGGALAGLDPILFGVITESGRPARPNEVGAWFYLTHWMYE